MDDEPMWPKLVVKTRGLTPSRMSMTGATPEPSHYQETLRVSGDREGGCEYHPTPPLTPMGCRQSALELHCSNSIGMGRCQGRKESKQPKGWQCSATHFPGIHGTFHQKQEEVEEKFQRNRIP